MQVKYNNCDGWYKDIRDNIFQGQHYCAYEGCNEEDCYMLIDMYQSEIDSFSKYLHAWSYAIVNRQVKIDLLNHCLFTIKSEKVMKEEFEKSKNSRVIIEIIWRLKEFEKALFLYLL